MAKTINGDGHILETLKTADLGLDFGRVTCLVSLPVVDEAILAEDPRDLKCTPCADIADRQLRAADASVLKSVTVDRLDDRPGHNK